MAIFGDEKMKKHATKEEAFDNSGLAEEFRDAFYCGWYSAGREIVQGWDSDLLSEELEKHDFLNTLDD